MGCRAIVASMNTAALRTSDSQLREWRQRRQLSQLDLAGDAEVSTRHLSFVETGRAMPSREMVLRLADRLDVPLRERNRLLTAAGVAPMYGESQLDDPALKAAREAIELVLKRHEPYPALAIDWPGRWSRTIAPCCRCSPVWRPRCSSRRSMCCA